MRPTTRIESFLFLLIITIIPQDNPNIPKTVVLPGGFEVDDEVYALADIDMDGKKAVDKNGKGKIIGASSNGKEDKIRVKWANGLVANVQWTLISVSTDDDDDDE